MLLHDNWFRLLDRHLDVLHDLDWIRVWNLDGDLLRLGDRNFDLLRDLDRHGMGNRDRCNCNTTNIFFFFLKIDISSPLYSRIFTIFLVYRDFHWFSFLLVGGASMVLVNVSRGNDSRGQGGESKVGDLRTFG